MNKNNIKTKGGKMVNTIKVTRTTTIFVVVTVVFILSYLPFLVVMPESGSEPNCRAVSLQSVTCPEKAASEQGL